MVGAQLEDASELRPKTNFQTGLIALNVRESKDGVCTIGQKYSTRHHHIKSLAMEKRRWGLA